MADGNNVDSLEIEIESSSSEAVKKLRELTDALKNLREETNKGFGNVRDKINGIVSGEASPAAAKTRQRRAALDSAASSARTSAIDVSKASEQIENLNKKIEKADTNIAELKEQIRQLGFAHDKEQGAQAIAQLNYELSNQKDILDSLIEKRNRLSSDIAGKPEPIQSGIEEVESNTSLQKKINLLERIKQTLSSRTKVNVDSSEIDKATKRASRFQKILKSIERIAFYRTIRTMLSAITDGFKVGIENLYQYSAIMGTEFKPAMDQIATSSLYLKNSLGAMAGPLIQALAPAIDFVVEKFVALLNIINQVVAALSGATFYTKAIKQAQEYAGATNAASKALKSFTLGIDELNVISETAGGAGAAVPDYSTMFEEAEIGDTAKKIAGFLTPILENVDKIAAGFAGWAIASHLFPDLNKLQTLLGGLMVGVGITLLVESIKDILFGDGLTWENILKGGAGGALAGAGLGWMLAKKLGLKWSSGMLSGAVIGLGLSLIAMSVAAQIKDGINLGNVLLAAVGGALLGSKIGVSIPGVGGLIGATIGLGLSLLVSALIDIGQNGLDVGDAILAAVGGSLTGAGIGVSIPWVGGLIGATIGLGLSLIAMSVAAQIKDGINLGNVLLAAVGGALLGSKIGVSIPGVGGLIGATIGLGLSLLVSALIDIGQNGLDVGNAILAAVGGSLIGAGIGFTIGGGPGGALIGATIGIGVSLAIAWFVDSSSDIKPTESMIAIKDILDRCEIAANNAATAMGNLKTGVENLDTVSSDFAIAGTLVEEIFEINKKTNATKDELALMATKVDILNGLNIDGLTLSIDETTGRVVESKEAVDALIEALEKEARMEAIRDLLVQAYRDQYQAMLDAKTAAEDYSTATSALNEAFEKEGPKSWLEILELKELRTAQEEASTAFDTARSTLSDLSGAMDLYTQDLIDLQTGQNNAKDSANDWITTQDQLLSDGSLTVEEYVRAMNESVGSLPESMKTYGEGTVSGLINGLDSRKDELFTNTKALGTAILASVKDALGIDESSNTSGEFSDIAWNVSDGFMNGLEGSKSSVFSGVGSWASGIIDKVKQEFGIHSPSKEFEEIGEYSIAGLENGLSGLGIITTDFATEISEMKEIAQGFSDEVEIIIDATLAIFLASIASAKEETKQATGDMVSMYRNMADRSNSYISSIISRLNSIPRNITTTHTIITENVTSGSSGSSRTRAYASGGFPEQGQMFIARERGPELVGTIGNKTAVANNAQIEAGIQAGVESANEEQNAILREQNELLRALLSKDTSVVISGREIKRAYDTATRQSGASIMAGGVMG